MIKLILAICLGALVGLERDESWKRGENNSEKGNKTDSLSEKNITALNSSFFKKKTPARGFGGVRTYTLLALLGGVAGVAHSFGLDYITGILLAGLMLLLIVSFVLNYFDKILLGLQLSSQ